MEHRAELRDCPYSCWPSFGRPRDDQSKAKFCSSQRKAEPADRIIRGAQDDDARARFCRDYGELRQGNADRPNALETVPYQNVMLLDKMKLMKTNFDKSSIPSSSTRSGDGVGTCRLEPKSR